MVFKHSFVFEARHFSASYVQYMAENSSRTTGRNRPKVDYKQLQTGRTKRGRNMSGKSDRSVASKASSKASRKSKNKHEEDTPDNLPDELAGVEAELKASETSSKEKEVPGVPPADASLEELKRLEEVLITGGKGCT